MSSKLSDTPAPRRQRGRPSGFVAQEALEAAMCLFWRTGYDAASVDEICKATRMPRATLYQRYGGKEGLFLATLDHYGDTRIKPLLDTLGPKGDLEQDIARFFQAVLRLATGQNGPTGCLISCVLSDAAGANPRFRAELEARFASLEKRIEQRIRAAGPRCGANHPPEVLAMLLAAIARGLMVRARAGADARRLKPVADAAASLCAA